MVVHVPEGYTRAVKKLFFAALAVKFYRIIEIKECLLKPQSQIADNCASSVICVLTWWGQNPGVLAHHVDDAESVKPGSTLGTTDIPSLGTARVERLQLEPERHCLAKCSFVRNPAAMR